MPICVECGNAVSDLYREFSKGNIRLTQCHQCGQFVDRYVEHEFVVIFIDLILHKTQVYRHLLFNRITYRDKGFDTTVVELGLLWIALDAYIRWVFLYGQPFEMELSVLPRVQGVLNAPQHWYISLGIILVSLLLETAAFHAGVLFAIYRQVSYRYAIVKYNYITMALVVSSFGKLILVPMLIWDYGDLSYSWVPSLFIATSNTEALSVFLNVPSSQAVIIVCVGIVAKILMQTLIHLLIPTMPIWLLLKSL